jgi:uncharacterized repeat protein (TIGR01451 family)
MRKNKKLLLIVIVAILAVSIPVTLALIHRGQEPSDGGVAEVPPDTTPPETQTSPTLTMLSITKGNVFVMKAGTDNWTEAQVRMTLESGDIIKSGNSSSAQITFFDGSTIELEADTEIEVVSLGISDTGSTTIKLKQAIGNTISRVEELVDSASSYEVETAACVAAVRGSIMKVNVIEDSTTWVTNVEGDIWVIANGVELQIPEGRKCIVISGQQPELVTETSDGDGGGGGGGGGFSPNPDIAITKMPDLMQAHEGDTVTYNYTVTNSGNVPLSNVSVTDDKIEDVTYQSGDSNGDSMLDTDETWVFTATYNVTTNDTTPLVNTAAASGTYAGAGTIIAWTTASVDILRPAIALNKTAEPAEAYEGYTITYTYTITNPGNTPLSAISVIDDKAGNITYEGGYQSGDANEDENLDTDESWVFTATYNVTADDDSPLVNNATATGVDALAQTVTARDTASVTIIKLEVEITSPEDGAIITSRNITVTGTVSDVTITEATIDINGSSHAIAVDNGSFSSDENVSRGVNVITVTATNSMVVASDTVTITVNIPTYGIRVELTWNTNSTDVDAHLIRPSGQYWDIPDDCYWENKNPDWGLSGVTEDNPSLDQDDTDGYGPENITLEQPYEQGIYQYKVHYWNDYEHGPSIATVIVWINDVKVAEYSKEMSNNEVWDCVSIEWPSGQVIPTPE